MSNEQFSTATRRNPLRFCDGCGTCGQRDYIKKIGNKMFCKKCREQACDHCDIYGLGNLCPGCTRKHAKFLLETYGAIDPTPPSPKQRGRPIRLTD